MSTASAQDDSAVKVVTACPVSTPRAGIFAVDGDALGDVRGLEDVDFVMKDGVVIEGAI